MRGKTNQKETLRLFFACGESKRAQTDLEQTSLVKRRGLLDNNHQLPSLWTMDSTLICLRHEKAREILRISMRINCPVKMVDI
mmetsp:Transcript_20299/g.26345  ORF Transcript_20299/g.26345 Transcript_20299/m.26345 type:complete len:83 (-) Transcript_20299:306-554(-)